MLSRRLLLANRRGAAKKAYDEEMKRRAELRRQMLLQEMLKRDKEKAQVKPLQSTRPEPTVEE